MGSDNPAAQVHPNKFPRTKYEDLRVPRPKTTTAEHPPLSTTLTRKASTASLWLPTSGERPYLFQEKSEQKRSSIHAELMNGKDDLRSIELSIRASASTSKPTSFDGASTSKFVSDYFSDTSFATALENILRGESGNLDEFKASSGWNNWPTPQTTTPFSEKHITEAFVKFMNTIIAKLGLENTRVAVDRQHVPIRTHDGGFLKPDVFVWATGSGAYPPMEGKPSPKSSPSKKRSHDKPSNGPEEVPPTVDWPWCLIPIEVKTEKARNFSQDYLQLGTYVREVFVAQSNRRFIPSFLITEKFFEFLLWDRAGVFMSRRVDYRQNFDLFCLVLSSILTWEPSRVGFDPTIIYPDVTPRIPPLMTIETEVQVSSNTPHMLTKVNYIVDEVLLRPYTISGRASTVWRVHVDREGNTQGHCLILDSWVEGGSNGGRDIYQKLKESEVHGLIQIIGFYDVQSSVGHHATSIEQHSDDTEHIRAGKEYLKNGLNLVHTRTVLRCNAVPLGRWSNPEELMTALRDAIEAHKTMYIHSKILHRDIVPWNIVIIRPSAEPEGLRGGLIDFTCATSIEPGPVVPRVEQTPGSMWFMSHFVLRDSTGTHLDDLESFYWVLLSILCAEVEAQKTSTRKTLSVQMSTLAPPGNKEQVGRVKRNHFIGDFEFDGVDDYLKPVVQLLKDLHVFCRKQIHRLRDIDTPRDPEEDYREFIGHFTTAIKLVSSAEDTHKLPPTMRKLGTNHLDENPEQTDSGSTLQEQTRVSIK